ncbi:MAG: hypothetical protein ACXVCV_01985 [Polyangia bacterium]
MHVILARALVAAVLVAGCGTRVPNGVDLGTTTGVPCADAQCAPCADQFCDTSDFGKTGSCRAHVAATNQSFGCDGPEDCGAQGVFGICCLLEGIGAACSTAGCGGNGLFMCHAQSDCRSDERCCALAAGTSYSVCRAGGC